MREWVKPAGAVLTVMAMLLVNCLLSQAKVLGVFSNSVPVNIACLFTVNGALSRTGCQPLFTQQQRGTTGRVPGGCAHANTGAMPSRHWLTWANSIRH